MDTTDLKAGLQSPQRRLLWDLALALLAETEISGSASRLAGSLFTGVALVTAAVRGGAAARFALAFGTGALTAATRAFFAVTGTAASA